MLAREGVIREKQSPLIMKTWMYEVKWSPQNHPADKTKSGVKSVKFLVGLTSIGTSWPEGNADDCRNDNRDLYF